MRVVNTLLSTFLAASLMSTGLADDGNSTLSPDEGNSTFAAEGDGDLGPGGKGCPCVITCESKTVTMGNCMFEVELDCDSAWRGQICFDCDYDDTFMLSRIRSKAVMRAPEGRRLEEELGSGNRGPPSIRSPYGECTFAEGYVTLSEYEVTCKDPEGNKAELSVKKIEPSKKSKAPTFERNGGGRDLRAKSSTQSCYIGGYY